MKGADHRLANVAENRRLAASARLGFAGAKPDRGAEIEIARHRGAGLVADQRRQAAGQFAFGGIRKPVDQHLGDDQPEHPVAEKFEPLVGGAAGFDRAGMRQRDLKQFAI